MKDGERVLRWIAENDHGVGEVAATIGCSSAALSLALEQNRICEKLAGSLYKHFDLRVMQTVTASEVGPGPGVVKTNIPSQLDALADTFNSSLGSP